MRKTQHNFEKKWKERFENFAINAHDDAGIAGWSPTGLDTRLRQFIDIWENSILEKNTWLDAGCGAGTYSRFMTSQGSDVIGTRLLFSFFTESHAKREPIYSLVCSRYQPTTY